MSDEQVYIEVGNNKYPLVKKGRAQAEQVVSLTRWISKYGMEAFSQIQASAEEVQGKERSGIEFILAAIGSLNADAILDLFVVVTGCTPAEAEEYFDVAQLIDAVTLVYQKQPAIRRVVERFFSPQQSEESTEESSMTSEQPMDGQTK